MVETEMEAARLVYQDFKSLLFPVDDSGRIGKYYFLDGEKRPNVIIRVTPGMDYAIREFFKSKLGCDSEESQHPFWDVFLSMGRVRDLELMTQTANILSSGILHIGDYKNDFSCKSVINPERCGFGALTSDMNSAWENYLLETYPSRKSKPHLVSVLKNNSGTECYSILTATFPSESHERFSLAKALGLLTEDKPLLAGSN